MVCFEQCVNPNVDVLASSLQLGWVTLLWGVQFSTVSAISAVRGLSNLIEQGTVLSLSSPLPRVFIPIGKEGVCALDVEATLVDGCLQSFGKVSHVKPFENS